MFTVFGTEIGLFLNLSIIGRIVQMFAQDFSTKSSILSLCPNVVNSFFKDSTKSFLTSDSIIVRGFIKRRKCTWTVEFVSRQCCHHTARPIHWGDQLNLFQDNVVIIQLGPYIEGNVVLRNVLDCRGHDVVEDVNGSVNGKGKVKLAPLA
jgi:hypothetical protein